MHICLDDSSDNPLDVYLISEGVLLKASEPYEVMTNRLLGITNVYQCLG